MEFATSVTSSEASVNMLKEVENVVKDVVDLVSNEYGEEEEDEVFTPTPAPSIADSIAACKGTSESDINSQCIPEWSVSSSEVEEEDESGKLCEDDNSVEILEELISQSSKKDLNVENESASASVVTSGAGASSGVNENNGFTGQIEEPDIESSSGDDERMIVDEQHDIEIRNKNIGIVDQDNGIIANMIQDSENMGMNFGVVSHNTSSLEGIQEMHQANTEQVIIDEEDQYSSRSKQIVCFVNQDAKVTPSPVLQYVMDVEQPFDTVISCADGKVGAHRLVLVAASSFIGTLFCSDHRLGEVAVIILPEIRVAIMKILLSFCYTGSMVFSKEVENEVIDAMDVLLMGEFPEVILKKVTLREEPGPMLSGSNIFSEQQQSSRIDRSNHGSQTPGSANREPRIRVSEMLTSSSSEGGTDSDTENDENSGPSTNRTLTNIETNDDNVRPVLSTFNNATGKCEEEPPYAFMIAPLPPGEKVRKLQCSRCPAAFKSMTTLEEHLEDNHSIYTESRTVDKTELRKLLTCSGSCNGKHKDIASTNHCLSMHKRTRCFTCFESVTLNKFEEHMTKHGIKQRGGLCFVKCSWCDAGIPFQSPFDNKFMSAHCFSHHFSGVSDHNINSHQEPQSLTKTTNSSASSVVSTSKSKKDLDSSKEKVEVSSSKPNLTVAPAKSKAPTSIAMNALEMLKNASQNQKKRKVVREINFDSSDSDHLFEKIPKCPKSSTSRTGTKKIRLHSEENIKKDLTMSKETKIPSGGMHQQYTKEVPSFTSYLTGSSKRRAKNLVLLKIPPLLVKPGYKRASLLEQIEQDKAHSLLDGQQSEVTENGELQMEAVPNNISTDCSEKDEVEDQVMLGSNSLDMASIPAEQEGYVQDKILGTDKLPSLEEYIGREIQGMDDSTETDADAVIQESDEQCESDTEYPDPESSVKTDMPLPQRDEHEGNNDDQEDPSLEVDDKALTLDEEQKNDDQDKSSKTNVKDQAWPPWRPIREPSRRSSSDDDTDTENELY